MLKELTRLLFVLGFGLLLLFPPRAFPQGYVCAIGGGSEGYNSWSDRPYSWIVEKADSGRIIILSYATGATDWLPDYFISLGAAEAYNMTIGSRADADLDATYDELRTADAIFLRGGNQWNYVSHWRGTRTEQAIMDVFENGGVIAGTSAGAAVLGEIIFSARRGSAYPRESLYDPFHNRITLEDDFLNLVPNVLFDTHFVERGRFGRLIPMLFNVFQTSGRAIIGVGLDDRTAICIDPRGLGTVMGSGSVAVFRADDRTRYSQYSNGYTINALLADQLTDGWVFDFNHVGIASIPPTARTFHATGSTFTSPGTHLILTGYRSDNDLNEILLEVAVRRANESVLIIAEETFESDLNAMVSYLSGDGHHVRTYILTPSSHGDTLFARYLEDATVMIIIADNLQLIDSLHDGTSVAGEALRESIDTREMTIVFIGNAGKVSGHHYIGNTDTQKYAAYRGQMTNNCGWGLFPDAVYQPLVFEESDYFENRASSVLWGMMLNNKPFGVYTDDTAIVELHRESDLITNRTPAPVIVVDARETTVTDSSRYRMPNSSGSRQSVAFNNLRISVITSNETAYSFTTGRTIDVSSVSQWKDSPERFYSIANYPNPFNPVTTIRFTVPAPMSIRIELYNSLGQKIHTIYDDYLEAGTHEVLLDREELSVPLASGVYFVTLSTNHGIHTHKVVLIK
jgi:cyanophycinase